MAKDRPLRNAAGKPRAKVPEAADRPISSRKPAAARAAAGRSRMTAPVGQSKAAAGQAVSLHEPVAPPPLPAPIASFTF